MLGRRDDAMTSAAGRLCWRSLDRATAQTEQNQQEQPTDADFIDSHGQLHASRTPQPVYYV